MESITSLRLQIAQLNKEREILKPRLDNAHLIESFQKMDEQTTAAWKKKWDADSKQSAEIQELMRTIAEKTRVSEQMTEETKRLEEEIRQTPAATPVTPPADTKF